MEEHTVAFHKNLKGPIPMMVLEKVIRPLSFRIRYRRFLRIADALGKISVGKITPSPLLTPVDQAKTILVIAPHPDDEVLGCGGTIRKNHDQGSRIRTLYMTNGCSECSYAYNEDKVLERREQAKAGLKVLGCEDYTFLDFQDSELRANKRTIGAILNVLQTYKPDVIFVPFYLDNHPDHVESALILAQALRKYEGGPVCFCYEVWTALMPNCFIDITDVISYKIQAIEAHKSQMANNNQKDSVLGLNRYRSLGFMKDVNYCEAFLRCSKIEYIAMVLG